MPSTELMNICRDSVIKAVKIKSSFPINHKSTCRCKNPKDMTLSITAFTGCMKFQLFGGIRRWEGLQSYFAFGEKDKEKATQNLVKTTVAAGREKDLQDNHKANMIKTSRDLTPLLFCQAASCFRERHR